MSWLDTSPRAALAQLRTWMARPIVDRIATMEANLMATEAEGQTELVEVITGTLSLVDAQRTQITALRAELANADATAQARVDAALAAEETADVEFLEGQASRLRELLPTVPDQPPLGEPEAEPTG